MEGPSTGGCFPKLFMAGLSGLGSISEASNPISTPGVSWLAVSGSGLTWPFGREHPRQHLEKDMPYPILLYVLGRSQSRTGKGQ